MGRGRQGKSVRTERRPGRRLSKFNPNHPVRLDGKALNSALSEALARSGDKAILGDMQNAKVQVYGDVAILTYNYVGVDLHKDGKTASGVAKSTRVTPGLTASGNWYTELCASGAAGGLSRPSSPSTCDTPQVHISIDQNPDSRRGSDLSS